MGLIDYEEAIFLWRVDKRDFLLWVATSITTLFLGIEIGVLVGVGASLAFVIHESTNPHIVVLGRLPGTTVYKNIKQYSEAYQNGRDQDKVDELTLERCFHDIACNENREQNLCSVQLNVAGLEEGCMVAGHSTEFQCGQGSVSVQNDNIKAVGIISGFQVQQGLNVGSPDYMFERSSHTDGFHMGFMACGVIENVLSSSVCGNYMRDSIASMDVWGRGVTASSSSFPVIKTKSGNALDENLCEHKVINSMVDGTASDGSSLRAHPLGQCKDSCTIPGRIHH
jgi:hypothetical protein